VDLGAETVDFATGAHRSAAEEAEAARANVYGYIGKNRNTLIQFRTILIRLLKTTVFNKVIKMVRN
jgi:hypothetical protein